MISTLPSLARPRQRAELVRFEWVGVNWGAHNRSGLLRYGLSRYPRPLSTCRHKPHVLRTSCDRIVVGEKEVESIADFEDRLRSVHGVSDQCPFDWRELRRPLVAHLSLSRCFLRCF